VLEKKREHVRRYRISNWRLLAGSALGFFGALIIPMDKFPPIHRMVDHCRPWSDIQYAIKDLNTYDYRQADGVLVGLLSPEDRGFDVLTKIININRPDLKVRIVAVAQNSPITLGGVPSSIIHVAVENSQTAIPVTTDFIFHEWVATYRERYFLRRGLLLITVAFLLGIIGRIEKKAST
jgi:hypothetical protein